MSVLWALRIYGPISGAELVDRTGIDRRTVVEQVVALVGCGLVTSRVVNDRAGAGSDMVWDVTERGKAYLEHTDRKSGRPSGAMRS
jgi:DNA-binding MarR family transcriptional regulator